MSRFTLSANSLADALARTAKEFRFPLGLEWVRDKETLRSVSHTWKDDTVGGVLRGIVQEYPGYKLQTDGGVVHVFRADLLDDRRNFLNLKVPDFFVVREELGGVANQRLQAVIQNVVSPRDLPPGAGEGGSYTSGAVTEKALTIAVRGATVRQVLERLAEASEHEMWIVTFSDEPGLTPTGFRRTETLWHPAPFPSPDQPMWDFLAWEEYPIQSFRKATESPP